MVAASFFALRSTKLPLLSVAFSTFLALLLAVSSTLLAVSRRKLFVRPASSLALSCTLSPASLEAIKLVRGLAMAVVLATNAPCQTKAIANAQNRVVAIQRPRVERCFVKKFSFIGYNLLEI